MQKEFLANYLENESVVFIKGRKELVLPGRDRGGGMEGEKGGGRRPRREAGDGERRDGVTVEKKEWGVMEEP